MRDRIIADVNGVNSGQVLEAEVLGARREDLLWRATGDAKHRVVKEKHLLRAREVASSLKDFITTPREEEIVARIGHRMAAIEAADTPGTSVSIEKLYGIVEDLLDAIHDYLKCNKSQLEETVEAAWQLHRLVDVWAIGILVFVALVLVAGSWVLINRVVRPTMDLIQAASRFGHGDFTARVPIRREDELGALSRTFNNMADEVAHFEEARLHFVASVAHDLKNPLVTIGGAARILKRDSISPEQREEWLDRIIAQIAYLENLTLDLMDTVQVSTGRLSLNKVEMDLKELICDVHQEQAEITSSHTICLEAGDPCKIIGDRNRIRRVALNLLSNALKYSSEGSTVLLKVEQRGSEAVFLVKDEGAGMSPEEMQVAFLPFGRGSRTQSMAGGSGMGLCVVKSIVEAHGGRIQLESEQGKGTTVEVSFPLA
ncbi:MAG: HAMP domain-containing sensor histidine kinase [Planctomycetota bacterium]